MDAREAALRRAHDHAVRWLASLNDRRVPARASVDEIVRALGRELPAAPSAPADVVDLLATACEPGLTAFPSGRFYGFVIGGTEPAALATDWLVSAWDQNCVLHAASPAYSAVEEVAGAWLLDLLGLPADSAVGFTTGATMANFTCLAAGRDAVLRRAGWNVARDGLTGGPGVRVLAGEDRHMAIDLALRYLGLGQPELITADGQGRIEPAALRRALAAGGQRPTLVILQAGDIHSGAFDPFVEAIGAAREADAWVHVDGAFGLWAAASPRYAHLTAGCADADSWATDAHKTLNVPYDCGLAIVRDPSAVRAAMGLRGDYLISTSRATPPTRSRNSPGAAGPSPCGRCSGPSAGPGWPTSSSGCAGTPPRSPKASPGRTARPSSTTWCSPRSAPSSATTRARSGSSPDCSTTARPGSAAPPGAGVASCASR
ncbi:pyridoxal-dependent decarboxylase [Streptomyces sp. DSM 116496]|uniref:pyridoxal phosphate-dependent decarboxylase family protein n=1 Tax=Streptomyces stoeckheimensis TaxID=3344656 RepID=UPI0038B36726